ncbi:ferredoxin-type protein NapF [Halomonas sp. ML-15]|uniref:ferredoxin-type protein NapF n=1 Tax=Halomonas sp. ML-15 TaxID=2773305 RepID=UPI0017464FB7|nr:ferredoxin-type protein NapF [Halomonas sp. ML-15]MBD3895571.1 ferredoxin-type protein NapF [Halomonas sp. ML-15]
MTDNNKAQRQSDRRQFFRTMSGRPAVRRPPWTADDLTQRCTGCTDCLDACPERVLVRGAGGYPEIRFDDDGCSLCGECAEVCQAGVFDTRREAFPWHAQLNQRCLALAQIHCQSCQDACEWRAIHFPPALGRPPQPHIDSDACRGCGACLAVCPTDAITLVDHGQRPAGGRQ